MLTTLAVVIAWSWLIFAALDNPRGMGVLWTMLGVSNQLLAVIALSFGTVWLVNQGKVRYAWVTLLPLLWVATTTLTGGYISVTQTYSEDGPASPRPGAMGYRCRRQQHRGRSWPARWRWSSRARGAVCESSRRVRPHRCERSCAVGALDVTRHARRAG